MILSFKCRYDDGETIEMITTKESLPDILIQFEMFLKGCGFSFDGVLDFVEEDRGDATCDQG